MTRKRFIKLLMSLGQRRNKAQAIAFYYNARNIPYAQAYTEWLLEGMKSAFRNLSTTAERMSSAFSELICAMKNMDNIFIESDTAAETLQARALLDEAYTIHPYEGR